LNGDGIIGISGTVIEASGSTSLVAAGNNFYLNSNSSGSGPELKYAGAPVVAGQFGAVSPIGAEQTATGYQVAWKFTGADQYGVWYTDSSGNFDSNIGVVSGTSSTLKLLEPSFHQDLNNDGVIGIAANQTAAANTDPSRKETAPELVLVTIGGAGNDAFIFHPSSEVGTSVNSDSHDALEIGELSSMINQDLLQTILNDAHIGQSQLHLAVEWQDAVNNFANHESLNLINSHMALKTTDFIIQ